MGKVQVDGRVKRGGEKWRKGESETEKRERDGEGDKERGWLGEGNRLSLIRSVLSQ